MKSPKNMITPNILKIGMVKLKIISYRGFDITKFLCSEDLFKIFWRIVSMFIVIVLIIKFFSGNVVINVNDTITVSPSFIFWMITLGISFLLGRNFFFHKDRDN
ncbi:MAG: hypothetical protein LBQ34_05595 [Alphaproteobacteria bacterium]|jgi:hypothetical protein|nr:hypothetical protein [Alphaproteobacteria bacterium]